MIARPRNPRPLSLGDLPQRNLFDRAPARRAALYADLASVDDLLARHPDAAALLLDGLLQRLGAEWFLARNRPVPPSERLLDLLEREDAPFAWRLRLALRAPDIHARLVAAKHCLDRAQGGGSE